MKSVTIRQRIAVFSVLGLFSPACSSDSGSETPLLTAANGAAGQTVTAGAPPQAGASAGTGTSATGAAGMLATTAGRSGAAGTAAASGAGAPAAGSGGAGSSATAGAASGGSGGSAGNAGAAGTPAANSEPFSFFVASWAAMQRVSKSPNGFGGDLRYGQPDGLSGADKICTEIAEYAVPGSGSKGWRAFLSVTKGPDGQPVHAIDRVGEGPWYDRLGRLIAMNKANLMTRRPTGADPAIVNDLPNEDGVPNHAPDGMLVDNHDILTGTSETGQLFDADWRYTCHDWTSSVGSDGTPRVGHSWPRMGGGTRPGGGRPGGGAAGGGFVPPTGGFAGTGGGFGDTANWMSALNEAGCAAGASLVEMGPPNPDIPTVGSGGGYGGIYCFALKP